MREFKFRAWDTEKKEMYVPSAITQDTGDRLSIFEANLSVAKVAILWNGYEIQGHNDDILMQYTGLKDKNGKEIYEGDIVHILVDVDTDGVGYHNQHMIERKGKVEYGLGSYQVGDFELGESGEEEREILGNIYENPELLEKKE